MANMTSAAARRLPWLGAIGLAASWWILRFFMLGQFDWEASLRNGTLFNLGGILLLAIWSAWQIRKTAEFDHTSWVPAFKAISKAPFAAAFLLTLTIASWNYGYANQLLESRKQAQLDQFIASIDQSEAREAFFTSNPELRGASDENVREAMGNQATQTLDLMYGIGFTTALNLLMLMFAALFFSILTTVLWRTIWVQ